MQDLNADRLSDYHSTQDLGKVATQRPRELERVKAWVNTSCKGIVAHFLTLDCQFC